MSEIESVVVPLHILMDVHVRSSVLKTLIIGTTKETWTFQDLGDALGVSRAAVAQHAAILQAANLVKQVNRTDWKFSFTKAN